MKAIHSDALVFFSATGDDLAYKKIFPSLQAMIKRGNLNVPVIGVAKAGWNLEQLKARAKDKAWKNIANWMQRRLKNYPACCVMWTVITMIRRLFKPSRSSLVRRNSRRITTRAIPPGLFGIVVEQLAKAGCAGKGARVIVRKAFRSRPGFRRGTEPDPVADF